MSNQISFFLTSDTHLTIYYSINHLLFAFFLYLYFRQWVITCTIHTPIYIFHIKVFSSKQSFPSYCYTILL